VGHVSRYIRRGQIEPLMSFNFTCVGSCSKRTPSEAFPLSLCGCLVASPRLFKRARKAKRTDKLLCKCGEAKIEHLIGRRLALMRAAPGYSII
jgi:hypothetical protein